MKQKKIVTMGGGTGTFPVVSALKKMDTDISAIVAVSDSGGSTGRIRDEFGFQPVGDLRQSLAALADPNGQSWIQKLLLYRFDRGTGLKGHNLGNLILTALQDMTGDTTQSLEIAEKVFNLSGSVIPVTNSNVNLEITYTDGSTAIGEHILDADSTEVKEIASVKLTPECTINPPAKEALLNADVIIIGPGDLYASIIASIAVKNIQEVFSQTQAKIIYMSNLMTRRTQTHNLPISRHIEIIEKAIGKKVDFVIVNNQNIPEKVLEYYHKAKEFQVIDDVENDNRVVRAELLFDQLIEKQKHDTSHRSLLRHDANKLKKVFTEIISKL